MAKAKRLVIGNWKMYVRTKDDALALVEFLRKKTAQFSGVEVFLAPPFPFIPLVAQSLKRSSIGVGAQALSAFSPLADAKHTGDVSAEMLADAGASLVIVGHSERRAAGEDDASVHKQMRQAADANLQMVLCIGERERDAHGAHFEFIANQLTSALKDFPKPRVSQLVIAYEPVWAIGKSSSDAMKPVDLRETSIFIKKTLAELLGREIGIRVPILYGGSVEAENAPRLIEQGDVSGFLVGHASTEPDAFLSILKACKK